MVKSSFIYLFVFIPFVFTSCNNYEQARNDINHSVINRNIDHLIITRHARCRMDCRHITIPEIKEILHDGNINYNKSQPNDNRGPKYALEGYTHERQHLRIIFAPENESMVVVTCIDLDNEWACESCN